MQVICEKTCVVRVETSFVSMQRGKSYDLPREKAEALVRGGFARPAQARKAAQLKTPRTDLEPRGDEPGKADGDRPVEPTPKKGLARPKRLDGPPENK